MRMRFITILFLGLMSCSYAMAYDFSVVCENGQTLYYNITSDTVPYTVEVTSQNISYPYYDEAPVDTLVIPEMVVYDDTNYLVTRIGEMAFSNCELLKSVTIGNSVTEIGYRAFYGCDSISDITIGNSVTDIGEYAFWHCVGLTSVTIPNSVTSIGPRAFCVCMHLVSLKIPCSVTSIGVCAFTTCESLDSIFVEPGNPIFDSRDSCNAIIETATNTLVVGCKNTVIPNSVTNIGSYAFSGCLSLLSIVIPNSVTNIEDHAFSGCRGLLSVTIGEAVDSIGDYAFAYCYILPTITIPNSVTSIGIGAFHSCGLTSIEIPNSVTSIGNYAFNNCTELAGELVIPNSITSISKWAFQNCRSLTGVIIPNSVTYIDYEAFRGCSGLTSVSIPNSVTNIGPCVFQECTGITEVTIPNSVTSIGGDAFNGCSRLTSVSIPNSVTEIGSSVFYDCSRLRTVSLPNSIDSIPSWFFMNCTSLTSVNIPSSVTTINRGAFYGCTSLMSLRIPSSVTNIGIYAFSECRTLNTVYLGAVNPPAIDVHTFDGLISYSCRISVVVPCEAVENYTSDHLWGAIDDIRGERAHLLNVESADLQMGNVSVVEAPDCENRFAVIEAIPDEGYAFFEWNDGNTDNPRTVEIISDTTFNAIFGTARTITIESSNSEMGYVTGSGVYAEGAVVDITAVPYEGYNFDHWIDVDNPTRDFNTENPRTIVVSSDVTYIAVFKANNGINENVSNGITIFPNPVTDILNITSSETISEIEIVNALGQVVKRLEVNADNAVCDVEDLTSGVYVVRIYGRPFGTSTSSATEAQGAALRKFVKE